MIFLVFSGYWAMLKSALSGHGRCVEMIMCIDSDMLSVLHLILNGFVMARMAYFA